MIGLLFQPWGILTMTDDDNLARPGLISPITTSDAFESSPAKAMLAQPMSVDPTPAPRGSSAMGLVKIAGLSNLVQGVCDQITTLRVNGAALQESVAALNLTMQGIKQQVDATHDDLKFEAETLGNGSGS